MSDDFQDALALALRRLSASDRFESEVRSALGEYEASTVDEVIRHLRERRILNDRRLTDNLVRQNEGRKAVGSDRLRAKLEARGAPDLEIEEAIVKARESEPDRAVNLLLAKFPGRMEEDRARAGRFLFSRGFDVDVIEGALNQHFSG